MNYLFSKWDKLKTTLINKDIFLFLDYDGTLTRIVKRPDKALIPRENRDLLKRLSKNHRIKIAIISGRALDDIKNKAGLKNIVYVGNHGLEIEGSRIKFRFPVSSSYKVILKQIKNELGKRLSSVKGVLIEDKGVSLSLHYRRVIKKAVSFVKNTFYEVVKLFLVRNKINIKFGKKVLEVRPPIKWDKGKAVLWLLARQSPLPCKRILVPIYIGDDKTDEDAFRALKNKGLTIFVGKPKNSSAEYYLRNTCEVFKFLERILEYVRIDKS